MAHPHSRIGASGAERWWNCPGSVREAAKCPPQPESEYAKEGTVAHKLAEVLLLAKVKDPVYPDVINGIKVTEEMLEAVQVYLDVIDADLEKYNLTRKDLQVEKKFHLKSIHPMAYGTCDAVMQVFLTKCIVYDFKYGSGVAVDAEDNKQGLYYALGAAASGDYDEFEIVIVQPRAIHKLGPVRRWTVSKEQLWKFAQDLKERIAMTEDPDAKLFCGEWCKKTFCPAIVCCPEVRKDMENAAMVVFDAEPVAKPTPPEQLTPLMLRRLLNMVPIIETYIKAVEDYALDQANKGNAVLGFKLVAKRSNRKWRDEDEVVKKFGKAAIEVIEKVLSPTQLETVLKKSMKAKEAKDVVEPLTFKPDTGNTLVPEDDPREAVQPKLEQTFTDESIFN